jgi:hypothetical protein
MILNQNFNEFEIEVYPVILEYWKSLSSQPLDFSSSICRDLIKDLNLLERDFTILEHLNLSNNHE